MNCTSAIAAFLKAFPPDDAASVLGADHDGIGRDASCVAAFMTCLGGRTFGSGVYRLLRHGEVECWTALLAEAFPDHADATCFGSDWLGRHYGLSQSYLVNGEPGVLFFDPAFDEVLEVPATFRQFHERVLAEHRETLLDEALYAKVLQRSGPATYATCYGYRVSPMLGGSDEIDNLEPWDAEVYLSLAGQILAQTR